MKKSICLAASLLTLNLAPAFGQPNQPDYVPAPTPARQPGVNFQQRLQTIRGPGAPQSEAPALTKFNLDFPGGTPAQLVKVIEKATGKPLNAIIPTEDADVPLPPLKMNNVDAPQLFKALQLASVKQIQYVTGTFFNGMGLGPSSSYSTTSTSYGFKTEKPETDDSVWVFFEDKPPQPQSSPAKSCRFYQLAPYLERGLTVDDITTAIQTGWNMMGYTLPPQISFHKETKLLIAVGEPNQLEVIDDVLKALRPAPQTPDRGPGFQERLQQIIKNQPQASVPAAPPTNPQKMPPESPADGQ